MRLTGRFRRFITHLIADAIDVSDVDQEERIEAEVRRRVQAELEKAAGPVARFMPTLRHGCYLRWRIADMLSRWCVMYGNETPESALVIRWEDVPELIRMIEGEDNGGRKC